jgi:hypothetical protein
VYGSFALIPFPLYGRSDPGSVSVIQGQRRQWKTDGRGRPLGLPCSHTPTGLAAVRMVQS